MAKKILISFMILFAVLFLSSNVFAMNNDQNAGQDIKSEMKDSWNKLGDSMQNAGNNVKGAIDNVGNNAKEMMNNNDNSKKDGYDVTRTSARASDNSSMGMMNSTTLTWTVFIVLGIAIIALVWYYAMNQQNTKNNNK